MAWLPRTRAAASTIRVNAGRRTRMSQSRPITFCFRIVEFAPCARSGAYRVDNAAARRPAAVSQRTEGSPHLVAICPATSKPATKAAEPMPRTQPYSNARESPCIAERDQESESASESGTQRPLKLQIERARAEMHRTHRQVDLQGARKAVSPPFRHLAKSRAIPALSRGPPGMPAGMATRTRSCNRAWHRGAETGVIDFVARPCPQRYLAVRQRLRCSHGS